MCLIDLEGIRREGHLAWTKCSRGMTVEIDTGQAGGDNRPGVTQQRRASSGYMAKTVRAGDVLLVAQGYDFSTHTLSLKEHRVSEVIVLVELVPCPIIHKWEEEKHEPVNKQGSFEHEGQGGHQEGKRMHLLSEVGWEIVGPGYSEEPRVNFGATQVDYSTGQESKVTRGASSQVESIEENGNVGVDSMVSSKVDMRLSHNTVDEGKQSRTVVKARKVPEPRWCPAGLTKTQRRRLLKLHKKQIDEEKRKKACDEWFNRARPMTRH